MDRKLAFTTAALIAFGLAACTRPDNGPVSTETRNVGSFDSLEVRGAAQFDISVGAPQSLEIEGTEGGRERMVARVEGTRLIIETHKAWWDTASGQMRIRIGTPQLRDMSLHGASEF